MSLDTVRSGRWWTWPAGSVGVGLLVLLLDSLSPSTSPTALVLGGVLLGAGLVRLLFGPSRASTMADDDVPR